jgi:heme exporter protein C
VSDDRTALDALLRDPRGAGMTARVRSGPLLLWIAATLGVWSAIWAVFQYAPEEKVMGAAQKIFYFHLPSVFATYASVIVMLCCSMAYLWKRDLRWDDLSRAATEIGVLFCTVVLVTGSIWARSAWGAWWTWEARITTTLVLWMLLLSCLMVRSYADNRDTGARLAAVVGIVAALDLPIIHKAVVWWRGQHPVVFGAGEERSLAPGMTATLGICTLALLLVWALVLTIRYRQWRLEDRLATVAERLGERS